jgi:DUF917 family protein
MRKLERESMINISLGGGLLGAGGGGSALEGEKLVDRILQFGSGVDLASVDEIGDDSWGAVIAGMGSPVASKSNPRTYSPTWAMETLAGALGFEPAFVIPFETGAGNSLTPMQVAIQKGIPVVDGDPVGRAVPQIDMTTFHLGGIPISPLGLSNEGGITAVLRAEDPYDMERVARAIASELGGVAAIACYAMQGRDMKRLIIRDTTTLLEDIGATIRETRRTGGDIVATLAEKLDGYILGRGSVSSLQSETRGGFDFGWVHVEGELPIRVAFQNENMVAWRNGEVLATVPDLICALDNEGTPMTNADIRKGMGIAYLGIAADPAFRTPDAVALFSKGLDALDYHEPFVPIEELMSD